MRQMRRLIAVVGLIALCLCLTNAVAFAQEAKAVSPFPDGVIVVPQGTRIAIDDNAEMVMITDNPVEISEGDTFIVYLQDLPIGYTAQSIRHRGNVTYISVEKADKSVYAFMEEEGEIFLTSDMYEFEPAEGVTYTKTPALASSPASSKDVSATVLDKLNFKNDKLTVSLSPIPGTKFAIEFSNLSIPHEFKNGQMSVILKANWTFSMSMSASEDSLGNVDLAELELGHIRVGGVGKVALKLDVTHEISMTYTFGGTMQIGFQTQDDGAKAIHEFKVTHKSIEGQGKIKVGLKLTVGIDVLVAEADVFGEIGVATQFTTKKTTKLATETEPETTIHCDDFRIYLSEV